MRTLFCPECDNEVNINIIKKDEDFNVGGEIISIKSTIAKCSICEEEIFDEALDGNNLKKAYDRYRDKHILLKPEKIKEIREMYGLSQRSLGALLGWGEVTIHRYETGDIQDQVHNDMLVLISNPKTMKTIFDKNKIFLTKAVQLQLNVRIGDLLSGLGEILPIKNKVVETKKLSKISKWASISSCTEPSIKNASNVDLKAVV